MKRRDSRKKVGLVLGSGAARGLAHIGVLKVLKQEGIPIDIIAGTSIGAVIGALYAHGETVEQIEQLAVKLGLNRFRFLVDPGYQLIINFCLQGLSMFQVCFAISVFVLQMIDDVAVLRIIHPEIIIDPCISMFLKFF